MNTPPGATTSGSPPPPWLELQVGPSSLGSIPPLSSHPTASGTGGAQPGTWVSSSLPTPQHPICTNSQLCLSEGATSLWVHRHPPVSQVRVLPPVSGFAFLPPSGPKARAARANPTSLPAILQRFLGSEHTAHHPVPSLASTYRPHPTPPPPETGNCPPPLWPSPPWSSPPMCSLKPASSGSLS